MENDGSSLSKCFGKRALSPQARNGLFLNCLVLEELKFARFAVLVLKVSRWPIARTNAQGTMKLVFSIESPGQLLDHAAAFTPPKSSIWAALPRCDRRCYEKQHVRKQDR